MILDSLISKLTNQDLHTVLKHHKANKADKQKDPQYTAYFCPLCKGSRTPHFRVSNGAQRGGIYNAPRFECYERKVSGHGAIELEAALSGLTTTGEDLLRVMRSLCAIFGISAPQLDATAANGFAQFVEPTPDFVLELMDDFTPEALATLGCEVRRMYTTDKGSCLPTLCDGKPVFRYSFGAHFNRATAAEPNFDPQRMHHDFGLYQLSAYTTRKFMLNKQAVSIRREAHELFPIFAFIFKEGKKTWGQIVQPHWQDDPAAKHWNTPTITFYNDGLSAFKVNRPLIGDSVAMGVFSGLSVVQAVEQAETGEELVTTKEVWSEEEKDLIDIDLPEDKIRVDNVLLCKDAINAVCAYYRINTIHTTHQYEPKYSNVFFHTVWTAKPDELIDQYTWTQLTNLSTNHYLMFDINNVGKRRSFLIAKRFNSFRMAFLPESLRSLPDRFLGHSYVPCCDILSFFDRYQLTPDDEEYRYDHDINLLFLEYITKAMPVLPLVYGEKRDAKTGQLKEYFYRVNSSCVWQLMATEGFCREIDKNTNDGVGRYLHIEGPFVRELDIKSLLAAVNTTLHNYAQQNARPLTEDYNKMSNAIIKEKEIADRTAINLPVIDVDYASGYGAEIDHFFYRNGALRITPTKIDFIPYSEVTFNVDRAEILPFDFVMPCEEGQPPFTISENPEYAAKLAAHQEHKKDVENYTQSMLEMELREITAWAQRNRWLFDFKGLAPDQWWQPLQVLRCFANDDHEKETELQRHGKELDPEDMKLLYGRLSNILYSLGRPLWRYRGGGTNYLPYVTENSVTREGRSEGGSGKSVFVNIFMGCAGRVFKVNGRNFKEDSDISLQLAKYIHHGHRVIHWEDYAKGVPIDPLFNFVTSGFDYRQRHRDEVKVPLKESPGHIITSNYQQTFLETSASGRVVPTGFSNRFNRGDVKKNKPASKVSDVMPGMKDDAEDMDITLRSQIAYLCAMGVQFCMIALDRVMPPMEELNRRSSLAAMGERFVQWAELFFSKPHNLNAPLDIKTLLDDYIDFSGVSEFKKDKFANTTHRGKMLDYADTIGIVMPDVCYSTPTERARGYIRNKAWCKEVYFDDERVWGKGARKEIRRLQQSQHVVFFCKKGEEPKDNEEVKRICKHFYEQPDPEPIRDVDGNLVIITTEERADYEGYLNRNKGKAFRSAEAAPYVGPPTKPGEKKPEEDLPF